MTHLTGRVGRKSGSALIFFFCSVILLWTAAVPFSRAFRQTEINYNEGWNVYNTARVAEHQPLYAATYGWTAVNYPALSFHLVAGLGRSTTEYLFTARILSLAGLCLSGLLAGLIVWQTARSRAAAWLTGLFLVAIFCANGDGYVGMDDPQLLAQLFFLAGIYAYLRGNRKGWALEMTALLFVLGGNIKHNLIEFPLAVLLDLLMSSPRRAFRFAAGGGLMAVASIALTRQIDGAAYVSCLLAPRSYSALDALVKMCVGLGPILLPTVAALLMASFCWKNPQQRVLALLLFCALTVNAYFNGGHGVAINGVFGSMLAIVLLTGVFWAEFAKLPLGRISLLPQTAVCAAFFLWLAIPMIISGNWRTDWALRQNRDAERRFAEEVAYMQQQPGPALCESLLRCAYAGKPYLYDPYNVARFIEQGRLDGNAVVDRLKNREFGAIQLDDSVEEKLGNPGGTERFVPSTLQAILRYYRPGLKNEDGVIYLPKETSSQTLPPLAEGK
jgi:hypothetical protein